FLQRRVKTQRRRAVLVLTGCWGGLRSPSPGGEGRGEGERFWFLQRRVETQRTRAVLVLTGCWGGLRSPSPEEEGRGEGEHSCHRGIALCRLNPRRLLPPHAPSTSLLA